MKSIVSVIVESFWNIELGKPPNPLALLVSTRAAGSSRSRSLAP